MKLSAYYKGFGDTVTLKTNFENLCQFDKVFISKVFTDSYVPDDILNLPNVTFGGSGFFYDKSEFLPDYIEHIKPDYDLYDEFVEEKSRTDNKKAAYKYFVDYSIGYTTRFCFRKCGFCVNKNYNSVQLWSAVEEFLDPDRKKLCLLDDNLLGCPEHYNILRGLQKTGKPFQYKQGLDIRLLNEKNAELLACSRYDGEYIFSFDDIKDSDMICRKLELWRRHTSKGTKLYLLCGYDKNGQYNSEFWEKDIAALFERIKILFDFKCLPYIMRYAAYKDSPLYGTYVNVAAWCNQPRFLKSTTYEQWCYAEEYRKGGNTSAMRYYQSFKQKYPDLAQKYYNLKYKS